MGIRFFVTPGRDYRSDIRENLYDRDHRLLGDSVVHGAALSLGPASDVLGDPADVRIGLYDPSTGTFTQAYGFGTTQGALTASSGGYCFDVRGFTGNATLFGGAWGDFLIGSSGNDALHGGGGNDILCGRRGNNTLDGGEGNDTYLVDSTADLVIEAAGSGRDTVISSVSFALGSGSEIETLQLAASTGTQALNLTGNAFANRLVGNDGANRLDGQGGIDDMVGGAGNDVYLVDEYTDRVIESAGGGRDTVYASADHCLVDGQSVEVLRAKAGSQGLHLMGNELAQTIVGGVGNDILHGDGGADILWGRRGDDTFAFLARVDATPGTDRPTIVDFTQGADSIFLKRLQAVDGSATDQAFTWIGQGAFSKHAGELHQVAVGSDTLVEGDTNGDGRADIQILLKGVLSLHATDFTL